jgi:hypothetical protein
MVEILTLKKQGTGVPFIRYFLREDNILILKWIGFSNAELIIKAHEEVYAMIEKRKITALVEDVTEFNGPFASVNQWFIDTWVPKATKSGLKKAGVIMNENVFTQLSADQLRDNPEFKKLGLGYRIFDKIDTAAAWIHEKE